MKKFLALLLALLALPAFSGCISDEDAALALRLNEEEIPLEYREDSAKTVKILNEMTLEDKLWQLFFVTPEAVGGEESKIAVGGIFRENAKIKPVGGIILFSENIRSGEQVSAFLEDMSSCFDVPIFSGVDEEGGSVSRLGQKGIITNNGNMSAVGASGDSSVAAEVGRRLGTELSALGFNLDFAPVADVLVNKSNTEIGKRSFGSDAGVVSEMVAAETAAMQGEGVSAVLKHFPGHGSTSQNSHNGVSVSERTLEQLRQSELKPFKTGIEAGADFVLVSHMSLPYVVGDNTPCSLSRFIISDLLKTEMDFGGVVITDALNMGAVSKLYTSGEAAVAAVEAGADMLLMPENLDEAHAALLAAVRDGRISEGRIDESVSRILRIKEKRGLLK